MSKRIEWDRLRVVSAIKAILDTTDESDLIDLWNNHLNYNDAKDLHRVIYSWDVFNEAMIDRGYSYWDLALMMEHAKGKTFSDCFMIEEGDQLVFFDSDCVSKHIDTNELANSMVSTWNGYGDGLIQSILNFATRGAD